MKKGWNLPCDCFFCSAGKPHAHSVEFTWGKRSHLMVAESLDPKDVLHTRICNLCTHEEEV